MADLDPKFETRAELEAWLIMARQETRKKPGLKLPIRRVTLAHGHLVEEAK